MEIKNLKINLNQECKVKLDKKALEKLQTSYDKYNKNFNENARINIDNEGYYHTQLHSLMSDFGDMICGCYSPFENCAIILDEVWQDIQN